MRRLLMADTCIVSESKSVTTFVNRTHNTTGKTVGTAKNTDTAMLGLRGLAPTEYPRKSVPIHQKLHLPLLRQRNI
jgi:hypothetical protein